MRMPIFMALSLLMPLTAAHAGEMTSAYTDLNVDQCPLLDSNEEEAWAIWQCKGYEGMPVWVSEGDLRYYVSFGENAANEMAATQTLPPFNVIGEKLEWRLRKNDDASMTPVATILRYRLDASAFEDQDVQVLVVTKLAPGATCHMAYIDARANPDANALARKAADTMAETFDCATMHAQIVGRRTPAVSYGEE
ncbi:MAG: hypothetical protein HXY22_01295 [Alphaproteobacteria bacterium]|nr:hypothetical protein [Alphaproteobacteria bacterium]